MRYTDNPVRDAYARDLDHEHWLSRRPVCSLCGEPIQDEKAVRIKADYICMGCIEDHTQYLEE